MTYFDRLSDLRIALTEGGQAGWADELLRAERSASTSGELIQEVNLVLRGLLARPELTELGLVDEVESIIRQGHDAWTASNR